MTPEARELLRALGYFWLAIGLILSVFAAILAAIYAPVWMLVGIGVIFIAIAAAAIGVLRHRDRETAQEGPGESE